MKGKHEWAVRLSVLTGLVGDYLHVLGGLKAGPSVVPV